MLRILTVIVHCIWLSTGQASFLACDSLHQFSSDYEFVGNSPIDKVDRNGNGWEEAYRVEMDHYFLEMDVSKILHTSARRLKIDNQYVEETFHQYAARAQSISGIYGETFRVSLPGRFEKDYSKGNFSNAGTFLSENEISNCSSYALDTYKQGILITQHSTPISILEHPSIFKSIHSDPQELPLTHQPAFSGDMVVEYAPSSNESETLEYRHVSRIIENNTPLNQAKYTHKFALQGFTEESDYATRITSIYPRRKRFVRLFRPIKP